MVLETHHIGFSVKSLERSIQFYNEGLGLELIQRIPGPKEYHSLISGYPGTHLEIAFLQLPNNNVLELIEYVSPRGEAMDMETYRPGNVHLALVVDDLRATIARLKEFGGTPRSPEPVTITSGPNKGRLVVYLRGPDGISLELFED